MSHISQEGVLDRAARLKREADAKAESVLNGLKLQRALLATALLAVAGAAGYFHVQAGKAADAVTALTESSQRDLAAAKVGVDRAEKDLIAAKAKLTELESARREESAALAAKVSALEGQVAVYRDEKIALQAKVDALQSNAAPQVTVYGVKSGVSTEPVAPVVQETKKPVVLAADKKALEKLAPWVVRLSRYSVNEGPGVQHVFVANEFREWCRANEAILKSRSEAKGWASEPKVVKLFNILQYPQAMDREKAEYVARMKNQRVGYTGFWQLYGKPALALISQQAEWVYTEIQVVGYIMSDATTLGPVKRCNE